jgi:hypothetical protein
MHKTPLPISEAFYVLSFEENLGLVVE